MRSRRMFGLTTRRESAALRSLAAVVGRLKGRKFPRTESAGDFQFPKCTAMD